MVTAITTTINRRRIEIPCPVITSKRRDDDTNIPHDEANSLNPNSTGRMLRESVREKHYLGLLSFLCGDTASPRADFRCGAARTGDGRVRAETG